MPIILYVVHGPNPPSRAVKMVIRILKLDAVIREVNLLKKENLEPWFLKLNPTNQMPVLDDNGYILTDSHAIIEYLFTVYAPKDILEQYFPTDPKLRGIVISSWHFEGGILFARIKTILLPILLWGQNDTPLEKTRWVIEAVEFLEKILEEKEWLAADRLTVADISTITTIDLIELLVPLKHYKNVSAWAKRVRNTSPFYNDVGVKELIEFTSYFNDNIPYDAERYWNEIQNGKPAIHHGMPIVLYTTSNPNPCARAVETVIRILKLDVENREVQLRVREHLEPWFVRLSPTGNIPVLDDNGYILSESHAIIAYLFTVYATKDVLEQYYPTDPKQRGIITSRWHFVHEALYTNLSAILGPLLVWIDTENDMSLETNRYLIDGVEYLDKILEGKEWLAGDRLTVVDISAITTIDLVELLVPLRHYKNVSAWAERVRMTSPFYDVVGVEELIGFIFYFTHNIPHDAEGRWHQIRRGLYK